MAEEMYRVLEGERYSGKHGMYYGKGEMGRTESEIFPKGELKGRPENIKMALEGAEDIMDNREFKWKDGEKVKDEKGNFVQGDEFVAIKGKDPVIEIIKTPIKKGKKK